MLELYIRLKGYTYHHPLNITSRITTYMTYTNSWRFTSVHKAESLYNWNNDKHTIFYFQFISVRWQYYYTILITKTYVYSAGLILRHLNTKSRCIRRTVAGCSLTAMFFLKKMKTGGIFLKPRLFIVNTLAGYTLLKNLLKLLSIWDLNSKSKLMVYFKYTRHNNLCKVAAIKKRFLRRRVAL